MRTHHFSSVEEDVGADKLAAAPATSLTLFVRAFCRVVIADCFWGTGAATAFATTVCCSARGDVVATPCDEVAIRVLVASGVLVEVVAATAMATTGPLPPPPPLPD